MAQCTIFNKSLLLDSDLTNSGIIIDIAKITALLNSFKPSTSGLWQPLIIKSSDSNTIYSEPLRVAGSGISSSFTPCDCNNNSLDLVSDNQLGSFEDYTISCNYCGSPNSSLTAWTLKDKQNNNSPTLTNISCCHGACDVRMKKDDYVPKIPVLSHSYITGFVDFKYLQEFPACTNPGLGFERFITIPSSGLSTISGLDLNIDWTLKATIDERPYDILSSQHDSEYIHKKSYNKSKLVSQTCGHFILTKLNPTYEQEYKVHFSGLSGLIGSTDDKKNISLPSVASFQSTPYGFDNNTYDNIFIKTLKAGSYWKWNYNSGIIAWYRYYDTGRHNDTRPIQGVDLYISPGDIFFATNDGPEPVAAISQPSENPPKIRSCPSGLKIVHNNELNCIIPSGSEFMYISANIYPQFYKIYNALLSINNYDSILSLQQAALLATAPQYDKVTVDLTKEIFLTDYQRNELNQIDVLNKDMSTTTTYDSVSNLNFISNSGELINTLANKYGSYLWIEPNTSGNIKFTNAPISASLYLDLDFDLVMDKNSVTVNRVDCSEITTCGGRTYPKKFYYDQIIAIGDDTRLSVKCFDQLRHKETCSISNGVGTTKKYDFTNYSTLYFNDYKVKSIQSNRTCISFEDAYPRIVLDTSPARYCTNCDRYSSYYLVQDADLFLCQNNNFCYTDLARRFNVNPQGATFKTEREVADNSLRLKRSYRTQAFNPYIDFAAFHKDNGAVFRSKPFGIEQTTIFDRVSSSFNGSPSISFITKDLGIKIYSVIAEKLQSNDTDSKLCKRFPIETSGCKCYGLNIADYSEHPYSCQGNTYSYADVFLPGLSTKYAASLSKYGGYSQTKLNQIFGDNVLTAGGFLPILTSKIVPDQPYGCDRSLTITLKNYINSTWSFKPQSFSTDHADVWVSVSEYGDPTADYAIYRWSPEDLSFESFNNPQWKRFFTKVDINNTTTLWKDQSKQIFSKNTTISDEIKISLQNPYLEKLTLDQKLILAPPTGDLLSGQDIIFGQPVSYADSKLDVFRDGVTSRGDETSTINISFTNKPRKQILAFHLDPPVSAKVLRKGFFHPNSGLTFDSAYHDLSPFKDDNINYDEPLYGGGYSGGMVLIGDLDPLVQNTFNNISQFDLHKKLRLYLKINNNWYYAHIPNSGGFKHEDRTFIAPPTYFEYVHHQKDSKHIPGLVPVAPKKHTEFRFISNHPVSFNGDTVVQTPVLFEKFTRSDIRNILLPGTRYYFMLPETDPAIDIDISGMDQIHQLTEDDEARILPNSMIKLKDDSRWLFIGINARSSDSYIITDYGYLYQNFSDLHIPYTATNKAGYVYNSRKKVNQKIVLYNSRGDSEVNTVVQKELLVRFDRSLNTSTLTDPKVRTFKIYTKLYLQNKPRDGYNLIDPLILYLSPEDAIKQYSFTTYIPTPSLRAETDYYLTSLEKTKWGDVLYYDGEALDTIKSLVIDEDYWYPRPDYKNTLYKLIINNHLQNKHRYKFIIDNNKKTYFSEHNDLVYYNIHQKYNTNYSNEFFSTNVSDFHNYLPFIDINLVSITTDTPVRSALQDLLFTANKPISGTVLISTMHNELPDDHSWGSFLNPNDSDKFWIHLPSNTELISAFVPNKFIHSTSLRIDDPIYWLYKSVKTETIRNNDGCSRTFNPSANISALTEQNNSFKPGTMGTITNARSQPFYSHPIYCDTDNANPSCGQQPCKIINIGSVDLTSTIRIATNTILGVDKIPDHVEYILSYDAGTYNPLGSRTSPTDGSVYAVPTIERFEITPDSWLDTDNNCSSSTLKPLNLRESIINDRYQTPISTPATDNTQIVKDTDSVANELLFRMIYGADDPVNTDILFQDSSSKLELKDLLTYTDPKVTALDIYKEIPYNYDRAVVPTGLLYSGVLVINGYASVGKRLALTIGSVSIDFTISKIVDPVDSETTISINGIIGDKTIYGKLYTEKFIENSLLITEGADANLESDQEDDTIVKVQERIISAKYDWRSFSTSAPSGKLPPAATSPCEDVTVEKGDTHIPSGYTATIIFPPIIAYDPKPTLSKCIADFDQCKDFQYAYCRRNRTVDCASCRDTFTENDGQDFSYTFNTCRNTLTVYGHTYREKHEDTSEPAEADVVFTIGGQPDGTYIDEKGTITIANGKVTQMLGSGCGPASPGIGRGCWGPGSDQRCNYLILDAHGRCVCQGEDIFGPFGCNYETGGPWTEFCMLQKCLVSPSKVTKIWHRKNAKILPSYTSLCPEQLCTISYNNYSVSITYPDKQIKYDINDAITQEGTKTTCYTIPYNGSCPIISISSIPSDFTIQESITSKCSPCNQPPLKLDIEKSIQYYSTITETRKCIIDTFVYGTINPQPLITIGVTADSEEGSCHNKCCVGIGAGVSAACRGNQSSLVKQCGGAFEWFACLGSMSTLRSTEAIPGQGTQRPLGMMVCDFPVPRDMKEGPAAGRMLTEWQNSINESYGLGGKCLENNHLSQSDIIHGILPGSCSTEPQYKTYQFKSRKARPVGKTDIEEEDWYVNVVVAYYEYQYVRPKTIQDVLKPEGAVCYNGVTIDPDGDIDNISLPEEPEQGGSWDFVGQINKYGQYQCWGLKFPSWFSLSQPKWPNTMDKSNLPDTFALTHTFIKNDACTNGLTSYYNYNLDAQNDSDYKDTPMPCRADDWYCWRLQRGRPAFLSVKNKKIWL